MTKTTKQRKKYFEQGDKVMIKKGKNKGLLGQVSQIMPNGLVGVSWTNGRYMYAKADALINLTEKL